MIISKFKFFLRNLDIFLYAIALISFFIFDVFFAKISYVKVAVFMIIAVIWYLYLGLHWLFDWILWLINYEISQIKEIMEKPIISLSLFDLLGGFCHGIYLFQAVYFVFILSVELIKTIRGWFFKDAVENLYESSQY